MRIFFSEILLECQLKIHIYKFQYASLKIYTYSHACVYLHVITFLSLKHCYAELWLEISGRYGDEFSQDPSPLFLIPPPLQQLEHLPASKTKIKTDACLFYLLI